MTTLPIVFSSGVTPSVSVNDSVQIGQVIARQAIQKEYIVNLADEFEASSNKVRKYIKKKPGEKINAGDILAVKKGFLGLSEDKLVSKVAGIFSRYERDTGNLVIATENGLSYTDIVSPVEGIVTICDNDKIVIGTDKDVYTGRKSAGGSTIGEVFVLDGAFRNESEAEAGSSDISLYYTLDSRAVGKIVVGTNFPRDLLIKCIGMEAAGVIGTEIRNEDIEYLMQRRMQVPIIETDFNTISKIQQWKNKKIYLNSQERVLILLHA